MEPYLAQFAALADARAAAFLADHGLILKSGAGFGAAILKLIKPEWTTDAPGEFLNTNGVFFSIWVDPESAGAKRLRYNLHARKLRALKGETFAARDFARKFRGRNAEALSAWPNLSFPKGPITLFEGHVTLTPATLPADASGLLDRFAALAPMVDNLLA